MAAYVAHLGREWVPWSTLHLRLACTCLRERLGDDHINFDWTCCIHPQSKHTELVLAWKLQQRVVRSPHPALLHCGTLIEEGNAQEARGFSRPAHVISIRIACQSPMDDACLISAHLHHTRRTSSSLHLAPRKHRHLPGQSCDPCRSSFNCRRRRKCRPP